MDLDTKLLLTLGIAVVWGFLMMGGVLARRRAIAELQRREGISLAEAKGRVVAVSTLVLILESAAAAVALLLVW